MIYFKTLIILHALLLIFINQDLLCQKNNNLLQIDSISIIEESNHVTINWTLHSSIDEGHFKIHRRQSDNQSYDTIATIENITIGHFVDTNVDAANNPQSYYITAHTDNGESIASSEAHQTIFIGKDIAYNICHKTINLQWSNYTITTTTGEPQPQPTPFDSTMILHSFENNNYKIIDYVSIDDNKFNMDFAQSGKHCFKLVSFNSSNNTVSSTSNARCIITTILETPEFAYLLNASVIDNEYVKLALKVDDKANNPSYVLHRTAKDSNNFLPIDTIKSTEENIIMSDAAADFNNSAYKYFFETLDSCGIKVKKSNTATTIYLQTKAEEKNENILNWNTPAGLFNDVDSYIIMRKNTQDDNFIVIDQLPGNRNSYTDILNNNDQNMIFKQYEYKINAVLKNDNTFYLKDTIYSNHAQIKRDIEIFIPNAFRPESQIQENRVFKPLIHNATPKQYKLIIFNNWGQKVLIMNNYNSGWDGYIKGEEASAGVYHYIITFKTADGKQYQEKGSVTLLR